MLYGWPAEYVFWWVLWFMCGAVIHLLLVGLTAFPVAWAFSRLIAERRDG